MSLEAIAERMRPALSGKVFPGSLKFDCGRKGVIVLADGTASTVDRDTDCTIAISIDNLENLLAGKLNPILAMATGKMSLSGNPAVAMGMAKLLG